MTAPQTIRLALIQTSVTGTKEETIADASRSVETAAAEGARIICLQELFATPYFCQQESEAAFDLAEEIPGPTVEHFAGVASRLGVVLIVPLFEKCAPGLYFNSAAILDADGSLLGTYRKMHIPDGSQFNEKYYFTPGDSGFPTWHTRFGPLGVCICWDQWFPEAARLTAMGGAKVIFYPTAIGSIAEDRQSGADQDQWSAWEAVQRSHAIANGCFVASVNRVGLESNADGDEITFWGRSFVADPAGKVIARGSASEGAIVFADVDFNDIERQRIRWPFFRDRRVDSYSGLLDRFGKKR